jgi:signal transduction histidine kinase
MAGFTATPVLMTALGGWCIFAPVVLHLGAPGTRATYSTTIAVLASGAVGSAWFLAWLVGRRTGRELLDAAAAARQLDTPEAEPQAAMPGGFDPEIHALMVAAATLRGRLRDERARFERSLERSRHADAAREEFLRVVSHQLRTPLNSICGYTQLLLEGLDGPLGDSARDSVQSILDSGRQLSALVDDVVDLAMLQSGRPGLKLDHVDVAALAREVARALASLAHGRPLELKVEVEPGVAPIFADRKRVRQVLVNLISNALKFTDQGQVVCTVRRRDGTIEVEVSDTGVGIAPGELGGIFDEFRQGSNLGSRRQKGAGLGLAICRRLVELHGGRIRAESQPGHGARFVFELPIEEQARG